MKQKRPLSYSSLKSFNKSPNHLLSYWAKEFKSTPAMAKGSLIHTLILEPEEFGNRYAVWEGARRAGAEYKEFLKENEGKEILKASEVDEVVEIINPLKTNKLLTQLKETELLIEWKTNGLDFKGFIDGVGDDYLLDIKTTQDASPESFLRDVIKYKYHWQAALYLEAVKTTQDFYIIAVETSAPYNNQTYKISKELIKKATQEIEQACEDFKEWDGKPAGYDFNSVLSDGGVMTLEAPIWL